ncbi:hypothetical protein [Azospirillum canadense]|uniref:hypothetical protein n=1 Tax=Azospirillum canadense TaxID=403962 RepID=UPI002227F114|nr:hypothetical protein [Azospirillum canadense]MCW2239676.1 hypothetical protein [Azospirillum canadense]
MNAFNVNAPSDVHVNSSDLSHHDASVMPPAATEPPGLDAVPSDPGPSQPSIPEVTPVATQTPGVDAVVDLPGDTDLYCGPNHDLLLFGGGNGLDIVYGFDPSDSGDLIAIAGNVNGSGLQSVEQLVISDTQYGALVDLSGGNAILLDGVHMAQLDPTDFAIFDPTGGGSLT